MKFIYHFKPTWWHFGLFIWKYDRCFQLHISKEHLDHYKSIKLLNYWFGILIT